MDLKVDYNNVSSKEEALKVAQAEITEEYVSKFKVKADISFDEANSCVSASGKGFDMDLNFFDNHCELSLKLSFLLKPLRGNILEVFERKLKKHL